MRYWALLAILGIAFLLQTTVAGFLTIRGVHPDLLLATVVSFGLLFGPEVGLLGGGLAGFLLDVVYGRYMGLHILILASLGLAVGMVEQRVFKDSLVLPLLAGLVTSLMTQIATLTILAFFGWRVPLVTTMKTLIFPGALYSAMVTALVYSQIHRRLRYLRPDPRGAIHFIRRR